MTVICIVLSQFDLRREPVEKVIRLLLKKRVYKISWSWVCAHEPRILESNKSVLIKYGVSTGKCR